MKYQLELVTWIDASAQGGWWILPIEKPIPCLVCKTAGFVINETDVAIRLACSIGDMGGVDEQGSELVSIPKIAIQSRQILRKKTSCP